MMAPNSFVSAILIRMLKETLQYCWPFLKKKIIREKYIASDKFSKLESHVNFFLSMIQ